MFLHRLIKPTLQKAGAARLLSITAPRREKCVNRVQLLGRVGRDPEQRGDVYPILFFPLATTHTVRSSQSADDEPIGEEGAEKSLTSWHNVTVGPARFRKYVMEYVAKGCRVMVDGSLSYYKSTLPDGSVKVSANIKAKEIIILSMSRQEESREPQYEEEFHSPGS